MIMTRLPSFSPRLGLVMILALCPLASLAQERGDLDVTMRMVLDDNELSERMVQELELPEPVHMAPGQAPDRPEFDGRDQAADARSQGRALGQQISEQARSNREELPVGRPDDRLELPPGLDDGRGGPPGRGPGRRPDLDELPKPDEVVGPDRLSEPDLD